MNVQLSVPTPRPEPLYLGNLGVALNLLLLTELQKHMNDFTGIAMFTSLAKKALVVGLCRRRSESTSAFTLQVLLVTQ